MVIPYGIVGGSMSGAQSCVRMGCAKNYKSTLFLLALVARGWLFAVRSRNHLSMAHWMHFGRKVITFRFQTAMTPTAILRLWADGPLNPAIRNTCTLESH